MATRAAPSPAVRPIVIRRVKKVVGGGHHGGAWKVAYADFVTAMMAFFMLLWLISNPDKNKLKGLAQYFSPSSASASPGEAIQTIGATNVLGGARQQVQSDAPSPKPSPSSPSASAGAARGGQARVPDPTLRIVAEELKLLLQPTTTPRAEQQAIQMQQSREGLRVSLMDDANRSMFRSGTAELNPYARAMLVQVARKIGPTGLRLAIEGHTDGAGGQGSANWHLSAERALAAREALLSGGLRADRFAEVVALAATQPVYPAEPDRPENRRITIVLLAEGSPLPEDLSARFSS